MSQPPQPTPLSRKLVAHLPLILSVTGMTLVFASVVILYFESATGRVVSVSLGLLLLLGGIWYAANPFFKNERKYFALRSELDQFIRLVRELNHASVAGDQPDAVRRATDAMHASVDRMVTLAGREGGQDLLGR